MFNKIKKLVLMILASCSLVFCMTSCEPVSEYTAKLNINNATLEVGEGLQLVIEEVKHRNINVTAYVVNWSSSNETVASVSRNGYVTSVEAGTCTIKANVIISGFLISVASTCSITVTDSQPVAMALNKTDAKLQKGRTLQLSAKVMHAVDKSVTWSSDSNSILVSDTGLVTTSEAASIGEIANIKATSVEDTSVSATCKITIVEKSVYEYDYTIMYYMAGSTLENDNSRLGKSAYPHLISDDIVEMLSVDLPSNVKVIIETGGTTKWGLSTSYIEGGSAISSSHLQRWEIENKKLKPVETLSINKMSTESSYESFLTWGMEKYGAEQMGVVISGHGGGICGCAFDDNSNSYLQNSDIVKATSNALDNDGRGKLTWMGFDCCLMQCGDLASALSDYFEYMVASQETESGEGWCHNEYLQLIADDSTIAPKDLLPKIASSYVESVEKNECTSRYKCLSTLSVLDLSKMNTFTNEFNKYVLATGNGSNEYTKYRTAFLKSYYEFGEGDYGLVDFADYIKNLKSQFSSVSTDNLTKALKNVVIANYYCKKYEDVIPCGLNAFLPEGSNQLEPELKEYNSALVTKFAPYQQMILNYGF